MYFALEGFAVGMEEIGPNVKAYLDRVHERYGFSRRNDLALSNRNQTSLQDCIGERGSFRTCTAKVMNYSDKVCASTFFEQPIFISVHRTAISYESGNTFYQQPPGDRSTLSTGVMLSC